MLIINGTNIQLTKEDTAHLVIHAVSFDATETEYIWTDADLVYFSIRDKSTEYDPDNYLVRKTGVLINENGESQMTIDLLPEDSANLEIGWHYFYDIIVYIGGNQNEKYTITNGDFELLGAPNRRRC